MPRTARTQRTRSRRSRSLRAVGMLALLAIVVAGTLAGASAGLLIGGATVQHTKLATLETRVVPALQGHVTVYVPLVDWQVDLLDHSAPANIEIEVRGIDRGSAGSSISSRDAARVSLSELRRDSRRVVERAVVRGVIAAAIGGVVGGLLTGALVGALLQRRRWVLTGSLVGTVVIVVLVGTSARELETVDTRSVSASAASTNATELPQVLKFAQQLLVVGDEYERHYATALDSVANLVSFTTSSRGAATRSVFVASDIHDNVFILDAFARFVGDRTVFAVGDFGQVGARVEERTAKPVSKLGGEVVAVSGNHDSEGYMDSLRSEGVTVLAGERGTDSGDGDTAQVDGLEVVGYRDPLERRADAKGGHTLRVYGEAYEEQVADFLAWFDALPERPDVVLVHQHGFAHRLVRHLEEVDDDAADPIAIFTGHDHDPHAHQYRDGQVVLVDGGTLGAGGPFAIGEQEASFAQVNLSGTQVVSVDIVSIDPVRGSASSERIPIG